MGVTFASEKTGVAVPWGTVRGAQHWKQGLTYEPAAIMQGRDDGRSD